MITVTVIMEEVTRRSSRVRKPTVPFHPPATPGSLSPVSMTGRRKVRRRLQCSVPSTSNTQEEEEEEEEGEEEEESGGEEEDLESASPRRSP